MCRTVAPIASRLVPHAHICSLRGNAGQITQQLRRKNASLEAKLRSLSICSLCAQPLEPQSYLNSPSTSGSVFASESSDASIPTDAEHPPAEDDFSHVELADRFRMLSLNSMKDKFFGAASSFTLVSNVIAVKEIYLGRPAAKHSRRPLFWDTLPWEKEEYDQRPQYVYPASDLIASLLDLYFTHVHPTFPLLHRPSFERSVAEELHLKDVQFGAGLLVVLGLASRYSDDPRVFVEGDAALSAGWKFVKQVQIVRKVFEPTLYDVQFYCLMVLFSLGTSAPQSSWLYLGLGIRSLQHRGEHRRKTKDKVFDPEEERWKRAFWYGVCNHLLIRS
ncbi:fungal-specific transcription factor domain-containing protein [Mycena vulgaris]|nr:fungal-specific transcription factor domain-containing protein [Mycena vulgaris]